MSTPPAPARVFGFVAAEADVCVLLRRGPSKQVLMVRWDLATDEFEIGQWLKARVYEAECDLSPDGTLFAYQANDGRYYRDAEGVYSVICRPPFFTALAFWAQGTTYARGFRWSRSALSSLRRSIPSPTKGTLPKAYADRLREADSMIAAIDHGWSVKGLSRPTVLSRGSVVGTLGWGFDARRWPGDFRLGERAFDADWADVDHRGRVLFARAGRVHVRDADGERELIDLNPYEFQPVEPPTWAQNWPSDAEGV